MADIYDVVVIGGGGSGLTAAIYASRANLKTLLIEKMTPGGQIFLTDIVENYPGFPEGVTGPEISEKMLEQAKKYGTQIQYEEVSGFDQDYLTKYYQVKTFKNQYKCKTIIIAAGAEFRQLGISGEKELTGKGVSYCATCDGAFFKEKDVVVIGGGDSAIQEGLFLTRFANKVRIVHRRDQLRASPILQERAKQHPKIEFIWNTIPKEIVGENKVEAIQLQDVKSRRQTTQKTDGVFIFIGHSPSTVFLRDFVDLDEHGYVIADDNFQTSKEGVFAAGEVRAGAIKQLVSACGEGCGAALAAQEYVENLSPGR